MDILGYFNKAMVVRKYVIIAVLVLNILTVSSASSSICSALAELCSASQTFLGGAIMIMILLAGATYAIDQVLGAETRARASVWATAMMTGALVGALIYLLTPVLVNLLLPTTAGGTQIEVNADNPCDLGCGEADASGGGGGSGGKIPGSPGGAPLRPPV